MQTSWRWKWATSTLYKQTRSPPLWQIATPLIWDPSLATATQRRKQLLNWLQESLSRLRQCDSQQRLPGRNRYQKLCEGMRSYGRKLRSRFTVKFPFSLSASNVVSSAWDKDGKPRRPNNITLLYLQDSTSITYANTIFWHSFVAACVI